MSIDEFEELFREIKREVHAARTSSASLEATIYDLSKILDKVIEALERMEPLVESSGEYNYTTNFVKELAKVTEENANTTLAANAQQAAESTEEYSRQPYLTLLIRACKEKGSIRIIPSFSGWKSSISVEIDMDSTAGSLEDWGRAVSQAREANDWNKTKDPIQASMIWRDSIFLHSGAKGKKGKKFASANLWLYTIEERLSNAWQIAPFWKLLNDGNFITMSSNRGGFPSPKNEPTHFVEKTKEDLKREFKSTLALAREEYDVLKRRVFDTYSDLRDLKLEIQGSIEELESEIASQIEDSWEDEKPVGRGLVGMERIQTSINAIARKYGLPQGFEQSPRFASLVMDIQEYGKVINSRVTKEGRVEITMSGGYRFRVYVSKLRRAFAGVS